MEFVCLFVLGTCVRSLLQYDKVQGFPGLQPGIPQICVPRGYVKTSCGAYKIEKYMYYYFVINNPDSGLAKRDPEVRIFDVGAPFLSLSLSL
jgi:hypothetical protein